MGEGGLRANKPFQNNIVVSGAPGPEMGGGYPTRLERAHSGHCSKADVAKVHRRAKVLYPLTGDFKSQNSMENGGNNVGTYGMASYWGYLAALLLRLIHALLWVIFVGCQKRTLYPQALCSHCWLCVSPLALSSPQTFVSGRRPTGSFPRSSHFQHDGDVVMQVLVLCRLLLEKQQSEASSARLHRDNQGNVFSLLGMASKKPDTAAILMELVWQLHLAGSSLAPCHVPREPSQWADELTHPDYGGFSAELYLDARNDLSNFVLLPRLTT